MTTTTNSPDLTFARHELPPIPEPDGAPIDQFDTYAEVCCGGVHAEVVRFAYWHPNDGVDSVEVSFEARLHVPDRGVGLATIQLDDPCRLLDVSQVAMRAALLLAEATGVLPQ
jgi:hypothetical protein